MVAYQVRKDRWSFRLAPQLVGKTQQAYAIIIVADAEDYEKMKTAILRRYDITEESYCRRFRSSRLKTGESVAELLARLDDLATKWMKSCTTRDELKDLVILEQLIQCPRNALFCKDKSRKRMVSRTADINEVKRKGQIEGNPTKVFSWTLDVLGQW